MSAPARIKVTVEDVETGETASRIIENDYVLVTAGTCYLWSYQMHKAGTHTLYVKGVQRPMPSFGEAVRA